MTTKDFDVVSFIIEFESQEISVTRLFEGFAHLIKSGLAWTLQGLYGRTAAALIEKGYLTNAGEITDLGQDLIEEENDGLSENSD